VCAAICPSVAICACPLMAITSRIVVAFERASVQPAHPETPAVVRVVVSLVVSEVMHSTRRLKRAPPD
jgi:hypothetical protein